MVIQGVVAGPDLVDQSVQLLIGPFVQLGQLLGGNPVGVGVKAVQVAQDVPGGIADFAVGLGKLFQNIVR